MGRLEWLTWAVRYGNPKTHSRNIGGFLAFELYTAGCKLGGYQVPHWLADAPPRPAGRYLRVTRPAPLIVKLLDKVFPFGEEAHSEYVPYTLEAAEEMRVAGRRPQVVEVSYRLSSGGGT